MDVANLTVDASFDNSGAMIAAGLDQSTGDYHKIRVDKNGFVITHGEAALRAEIERLRAALGRIAGLDVDADIVRNPTQLASVLAGIAWAALEQNGDG